jgi:hypothetical protein
MGIKSMNCASSAWPTAGCTTADVDDEAQIIM